MVFVIRGMSMRIPAGAMEINLVDGTSTVWFEASIDLWHYWIDIAIRELREARSAHADLVDAVDDDVKGEAMEAELRHSMVAVVAAACALDAFCASVRARLPSVNRDVTGNDQADDDGVVGDRTPGRITDTLRRGYRLGNDDAKEVRRCLTEIFRYRGFAVHPPGSFKPTQRHPDLATDVEWRFVAFSASNAKEIIDGALSLIRVVDRPRAEHTDLVEWSAGMKTRLEELTAVCTAVTEGAIPATGEDE